MAFPIFPRLEHDNTLVWAYDRPFKKWSVTQITLKWGALFIFMNKRSKCKLKQPLQDCTVQSIGCEMRVRPSNAKRSIRILFPKIQEAQEWVRLVRECTKWRLADYFEISPKSVFENVYKAVHRRSSNRVLIKVADNEWNDDQVYGLEMVTRTGHKNIADAMEIIYTENKVYEILHYMDCTLTNLIATRGALPAYEACILMRQLLEGVEYLHQNRVAHRNLCPNNILIRKNRPAHRSRGFIASAPANASSSVSGNSTDAYGGGLEQHEENDMGMSLKISDFASAEQLLDGHLFEPQHNSGGTINYMGPEIFSCSPYGLPIDMYACGCILFEMLTGQILYLAETEKEVKKKIVEGKWASTDVRIPRAAYDLLCSLLQPNPLKRITAHDALNHQWFKSLITIRHVRKQICRVSSQAGTSTKSTREN